MTCKVIYFFMFSPRLQGIETCAEIVENKSVRGTISGHELGGNKITRRGTTAV